MINDNNIGRSRMLAPLPERMHHYEDPRTGPGAAGGGGKGGRLRHRCPAAYHSGSL